MALSCIVSEIKRDIDQKSRFFILVTFSVPLRDPRRSIAIPFGVERRNLAIADNVSCAHNMSRASIVTPWPWNLCYRVHSSHWKWHHL